MNKPPLPVIAIGLPVLFTLYAITLGTLCQLGVVR